MTILLSTSSLAGTARTLVAVGTPRLAVMLVTVRAAAPRSLATSVPSGGLGGEEGAGPGGEDGAWLGAEDGARVGGAGARACGAWESRGPGADGGASAGWTVPGPAAVLAVVPVPAASLRTGWGPVPLLSAG